MMVMSPSPMNAPSIVSPSSMVRQITSATGQEEQVDFMVSLGCENGGLEHLHFPPKAHLHSGLTTPRKHPSTHSENGRAPIRPTAFLVVVGDVDEAAELNAHKLKARSRTDTDVAVICARDVKFVAENWRDYSSKRDPVFDLQVFNMTGILDRRTLTNRMKWAL